MTAQQMKAHAEERINRVYADVDAKTRQHMIAVQWAAIDAHTSRNESEDVDFAEVDYYRNHPQG